MRAYEFDAAAVLRLCEEDRQLGMILVRSVAEILAHRLETTRGKLMEQYGTRRLRCSLAPRQAACAR